MKTSPKPICFLDMDGVVNSSSFLMRRKRNADGELYSVYAEGTWNEMIDPTCVARLNRIVRASGAHVVLSSSWRHALSVEAVDKLLRAKGFAFHLIGATPTINERGKCRGDEIKLWLQTNSPQARFAILDDVEQMGSLRPWLVKTSFLTGLTDEDVVRAIEMLSGVLEVKSVHLDRCKRKDCTVCLHPRVVRAADAAAPESVRKVSGRRGAR
jgi:hypothetical protein